MYWRWQGIDMIEHRRPTLQLIAEVVRNKDAVTRNKETFVARIHHIRRQFHWTGKWNLLQRDPCAPVLGSAHGHHIDCVGSPTVLPQSCYYGLALRGSRFADVSDIQVRVNAIPKQDFSEIRQTF
ncbi:Uncharacterised protein at_DN1796 [Pycnogonum litorale]